MKTSKKIITFLIVVMTLFVVGSCTRKSEEKSFVLAQGMGVLNAPIFVTNEKNFWADRDIGLNVEVRPFLAGRLALDALLAGNADVATIADTPVMYGLFRHPQLRIIASVMTSSRDEKVLARRDSGIESLKDLEGKKVATFFGTSAEFYTNKIFTANGISLDKIMLINLKGPDMVSAIVKGDIDAYIVWEPHIQNGKQRLGENAIVFVNEEIYLETWNIVVLEKLIKENPELIRRILKAVIRGVDYLNKNRDESIAITAKQLGLDIDVVKNVWDDYHFEVTLNKGLLKALQEQGKWAKDTGKVDKKLNIPDYRKAIYTQVLAELLPHAVTIK